MTEPDDEEPIRPQRVFLSPAGYQPLLDYGPVSYIPLPAAGRERLLDRSFESAADAYGSRTLAVLLRTEELDGAQGLEVVKKVGEKAVEVKMTRSLGPVRFPAEPSPVWLDRMAGVQ